MNGINHKQAKRHMHADMDGLLDTHQRRDLEAHLHDCEACRAESESLSTLTARLQSGFHARWDTQNGPSTNVMANVHSQTRRIIMLNRINVGLRTLAGIAALLIFGFVITSVVSQLRNTSTGSSETNTTVPSIPAGLIAFVSRQDGNEEIYTMYTNGSELTNLTDNPAYDSFPAWSPDGTRLAFISDRLGQPEIFVMNADGSNVIQLTDVPDTASWWDPLSWSPDGQWLVASRIPSEMTWVDKGQVNLYVINTDGSGAAQITTNEVGHDMNPKWSLDGKYIAFLRTAYTQARIYSVHPDGSNLTALVLNINNEGIFDWAPNGQLYYLSTDVPCWTSNCVLMDEIGTINADGTNQKSLLTLKLRDPSCTSGSLILSPDGARMLIRFPFGCTSEGQVFIVNSDGTDFRELINLKNLNLSPGEWISQVNWSPDGKFVVFVAGKDPNQDIYILDVDKALHDPSTQPVPLTDNSITGNANSPVWRPNP